MGYSSGLRVCINIMCNWMQDGLWGNFSTLDRKLITHTCPPGYCDCEQSFQNGSDNVGCLLKYDVPSSICDKIRTGIVIIIIMASV